MLYEIYPVMYYDKDKLYVRLLSYGVIYKLMEVCELLGGMKYEYENKTGL